MPATRSSLRGSDTDMQVVVSVPHSGTRTLVKHLRLNDEPGVPGVSSKWWHFGASNPGIKVLLKRPDLYAHVPVRNPMDVAASWAQRRKTGDPLANLIHRYRLMFDWMAGAEGRFTLYRIEDIPPLVGTGEHKDAEPNQRRIAQYQSAVREQIVEPNMDFFLRFYDREMLNAG